MNNRFSLAIAAAVTLLPAAPAVAKQHSQPTRPVITAAEGASIRPATVLGRVPGQVRLSLPRDRKVDVAKLRGVKVARKSAARRLRAVMGADKTVGARVLLLSGTGAEPTYVWWKLMLAGDGVPFDTKIIGSGGSITEGDLQNSPTSGKYQAIILASGSLTDCAYVDCTDTMGAGGWQALQTYEKAFAVREIAAYGWPSPAYGADWSKNNCGNKSSMNLTVTPAGATTFADLNGTIPTDKNVWGCEMTGIPGSSFTPLVSGPNGAVVATFTRTDGVDTMFNSIDGSDWTIHSRLLFHGMLKWVTKGIYLGSYRNYVGIDVDDVLIGNDRWDPSTKTLNPDESTIIRMTPADVQRAVSWEASTGVSLNMLFNAVGSEPIETEVTTTTGKGKNAKTKTTIKRVDDQLTKSLIANKNAFRWTSHTYTHADLDGAGQAEIVDELNQNVAFAKKNGLPGFNTSELTTGGHSGLTNPAMPAALTQAGIKSIGSDASLSKTPTGIGSATTLPRYPTGVYYNVGTKAEQLDEYNYLNYTLCTGTGNPGCLSAPVDWDGYVNNEATMILRHILANDPRPHYVHQSNLAEEGTLYPVANEVIRRYRSYLKVPVVQSNYTEAGATLAQQAAWSSALNSGKVSGTISATGMTITNTGSQLAAPATGLRVLPTYGVMRSGWMTLPAGTTTLGI
ncbi:MAG: hypothetical protein ACJ762_16680 [Solirubrobacteraceae bacterium]